jgi:hypothetical protein
MLFSAGGIFRAFPGAVASLLDILAILVGAPIIDKHKGIPRLFYRNLAAEVER